MVKAEAGILDTGRRGRRRGEARPRGARALPRRGRGALGRVAPAPPRRPRRGARAVQPRRGVRRLAPLLRGARRAPPARARLRGPALGRRGAARLRRPARRPRRRRAAARPRHRAARPLRAARRLGRRQAQRATASLSPLTDADTARLLDELLETAPCSRRDAAGAARRSSAACRSAPRSTCGCSQDRGLLEQRRRLRRRPRRLPLPGDVAGDHRRAPRRAHPRGEGGRPGRRRDRAQLLDRRAAGDRRPPPRTSWSCGCTPSSARSSCAASAAPRWRARASTCSGTCSSATSRTGRSRARRGPSSTASPPSGSSGWAPTAPTTAPRCSPTTTSPRSIRPRGRASRRATCSSARRLALREAGDRATALHAFRRGARFYAGAVELWPEDDSSGQELRLATGGR